MSPRTRVTIQTQVDLSCNPSQAPYIHLRSHVVPGFVGSLFGRRAGFMQRVLYSCAALAVPVLLFGVQASDATTISVAETGNVLSASAGTSVVSPSQSSATFSAVNATDDVVRAVPPADQDHGLIFTSFDSDQRLGVTGSLGPI